MPGTGLDTLHMCFHVFFTKHLWSRYYYIYFVEKEIEFIQLDWFSFLLILSLLICFNNNHTYEKNKQYMEKNLNLKKIINRHQYWDDKDVWII